ncbi:hypothetical protein H6P81_013857 [Aristolochia fimbriata]|uniref:UspA domain-containing protein n=1 Tax=Aristolochia fimbriata TaxID=158543 RepID=A0AAV7EHH5_ARIFI|nr:hypothetical protein H6P81_013857 [Aristolochia fimbriata]
MEAAPPAPRKVMVVADPGRESTGALQWVLSHAVLDRDEIVLLHVEAHVLRRNSFSNFLKRAQSHPPSASTSSASMSERCCNGEPDFLESMRLRCVSAQPRVHVQIEKVEMEGGRDKAATILFQCNKRGIDLLVIGQRRTTSFLSRKLSSTSYDLAECLIENSRCQCIGVQKKGQNAGYLLNSKTHKNFWLLA